MSKNKANIVAVLGASGSGKSTFVKRAIEKASRLIVFDPMHEYGKLGRVTTTTADLLALMRAAGPRGPVRAIFQPCMDPKIRVQQFETVCAIAHAAGNLTLVAEELKFVTQPGRAPMRWAQVTLTGRHKGLRVIGTSQRPASIDKDFLGNATLIRTGCLTYPEDIRAVAKAMQVPEAEIAALKPLDWIEKEKSTGKKLSGRLTF